MTDGDMSAVPYEVLIQYGIHKPGLKTIQSGGPKVVWRVDAGGESFILKKMRHEPSRAAFCLGAQRYACHNGARVPAVLPALSGDDYVLVDGQVFALHSFIEGRSASWSRPGDFQKGIEALADLHLRSRGYRPPEGARVSTKLGSWPRQYQSMIERFEKWRQVAVLNPDNALNQVFLKSVDRAATLAGAALDMIRRCGYAELCSGFERRPGVCHQDYGEGNSVVHGDEAYIIDLDGVTFDLPARDLRKVITKSMIARQAWEQSYADRILSWYERVNPLTHEDRTALFVDLLFPHTFHDVAKNPFHKGKPTPAAKILEAARFEVSKAAALRGVLKDRFGLSVEFIPEMNCE